MDLFILNPLEQVVKNIDTEQIKGFDSIRIDTVPKPLENVEGIGKKSDKILIIDPDFVGWKLGKEQLDLVPNIKAIIISSTSYSWVDMSYLESRGIIFRNAKDFSSHAVAEWGVTMTLALSRKLPLLLKNEISENTSMAGQELIGKIFGIIGLGNIGNAYAEKVEPYSSETIYWSRNKKDKKYKFTSASEVCKTADVIYISYASDGFSEDIFTLNEAKQIRQSAIVVCARKPSKEVHEYLLARASKGELYGYGFESGFDFYKYEGNVWAGPIMAWATEQSFRKNWEMTLKELTTL